MTFLLNSLRGSDLVDHSAEDALSSVLLLVLHLVLDLDGGHIMNQCESGEQHGTLHHFGIHIYSQQIFFITTAQP
jgi:hypothetical protein